MNSHHPQQPYSPLVRQTPHEALEARFALRITSALSQRPLGHDVGQRLRVAREQALEKARKARLSRAAAAGSVQQSAGGLLAMGGSPWWLRLASLAPVVVLALGFMLIQRIDSLEQIQAAAEIDAVLLADELPPRAYSDPGFGEFLKQPHP